MPVSVSVIVRSSGNVVPVPVLTVTVDVPPASAMVSGATDSTSTGALSSSTISCVAVGFAGRAAAPGGFTLLRVTVNVSSSSSMRSSSVDTVKVCWVSPTANVRVPLLAVKSVCAAVSPAATEVA